MRFMPFVTRRRTSRHGIPPIPVFRNRRNFAPLRAAVAALGLMAAGRPLPADETCSSPYLARIEGQEDFIYVWTLGEPGLGDGSDKLVTLDVRPGSPTYGQVIQVDSVGSRNEAHHAGFTDDRRQLWLAGLETSRIFIYDIYTDPAHPRHVKTIDNFAAPHRRRRRSPRRLSAAGPRIDSLPLQRARPRRAHRAGRVRQRRHLHRDALDAHQGHPEPSGRGIRRRLHTTSNLLYKNALLDTAKTIFSGLIVVDPDAQKTDAYQSNRNLMLSDEAEANSLPGLEIQANDVRCTHGATSARIDAEQEFYLQTRGIAPQQAQELLVFGFFEEVLSKIENQQLHDTLGEIIRQKFKK
ncbi:MAG: selenium-binding protein SBP56-related protein [Lacunisphaera sp.]